MGEEREMAEQWSYAIGPSQPPVRELTLGGLLREVATELPDRLALVAGVADPAARRTWTYAELLDAATRTARALRAHFEPGERVAVWAPNYPEWVVLEFACGLAGIVLVTVNPGFRPAEAQFVLAQSRAAGAIVARDFRGNPMRAVVEELRPSLPELREVWAFDEWEALLADADAFTGDLGEPAPGDGVMIQYTSGTTGFPKGALLHHRGLVNNGAHLADRAGAGGPGVWIAPMPLFHTGGCVCTVLAAVSSRSTIVLMESFDPGLALELFEAYRGTMLLGVPTMLIAMLEHPRFADADLSSVRAICSGGSLVPAPLVRRFEDSLKAPFTIVFGQTECSPIASMTRADDSTEDKGTTIGGPMPGVEVKIIDPGTGATLPHGEVGEYCTRGYHVMLGYWENPEATAAAIDADGWLHTGDLCAMDERGYCSVEGRLKDMIIRGGENIYPSELETVLMEHPSVGEVAIVGLPDERWGETVAAFVRPAPGCTVDPNVLFAFVRERLAPHKTPRQWFAVDAFPMTGSGKIQKYRLREQWLAGEWTEL